MPVMLKAITMYAIIHAIVGASASAAIRWVIADQWSVTAGHLDD